MLSPLEITAQLAVCLPALRLADQVDLRGYSHREYGAIALALEPYASVDITIAPRAPAYLMALAAEGSQPEGFSVQITADDGRYFPIPLPSRLLDPATVEGVTLNQRMSAGGPRLLLGALKVTIRSLSGLAQDCDVVLTLAEPDGEYVPVTAQNDAIAAALVASDFADSGGSLRLVDPVSVGGAYGGGLALGDIQTRNIEISVDNQLAVLLPAQPSAIDIFTVLCYLDGNYGGPVSFQFFAENARGESRKIGGRFYNVQPGGSVSFPFTGVPIVRLQAGERLTLSTTNGIGALANISGYLQFRPL